MAGISRMKEMFRNSNLATIATALCVAPLSVGLFAQGSDAAWRIDAPPSTMALTEIKHGAGKTVFVLENVSGKRITAFSLSHDDATHTTDYFETGNDLAPNAYDELTIGDRELQSATERVLRLSAVVFADGTTVGGQDPIDLIVGRRVGVTTEMERIAGILRSSGDAGADDRSMEALEARIGDLPHSPEEAFAAERGVHIAGVDLDALSAGKGKAFAHAFFAGIGDVREVAKWRVSQLRQIPIETKSPNVPNRASVLSQLRESYADATARNKTLLTQQGGIRQ